MKRTEAFSVRVHCWRHGGVEVQPIAPVGPTLTRPELRVVERTSWDGELYGADPDCVHYVYAAMSGVKCVRCAGWYCA